MGIFKSGSAELIGGGVVDTAKSKDLGQQQLEMEKEFMGELGGIYQPRMQAGEQAFSTISDYFGGNQQPVIDQAMQSPMYSSLLSQGEDAIARNRQAMGGFRSGTTAENLAQNSQNVLMDQINQILQGNQYVANAGGNATSGYVQGKGGALGQIGNTAAGIASVNAAREANRQNQQTGTMQMLGGLAGSLIPMLSDKNLKENIVKIGEKHGLNWYKWDWNEAAKRIGLTGADVGHIAQEVEKVRPDLVTMKDGYKAVIYGGF